MHVATGAGCSPGVSGVAAGPRTARRTSGPRRDAARAPSVDRRDPGLDLLELKPEPLPERLPLPSEVGDRITLEHGEERPERLAQRGIEVAGIDQRTADVAALETLRHGEVLFGQAHGLEQRDLA